MPDFPTIAVSRRAFAPRASILALALALSPIALRTGERSLPIQLAPEILTTTLTDISGKNIHPFACAKNKPANVLIFTSVDCPIANSYAPEINRIAKAYASKGVRLILVHVDPALSTKAATTHATDYALGEHTRIVIDRRHQLVEAVGATITPEAAVVTPDGQVVYRGRINNLYADFGDKRAAPSEHNLRNALDALLAGDPIATPITKTIGCIIEPL